VSRAVALAAGCVVLAGAALAQADAVTMSLAQYRDGNGVRVLVFTGTISNGRSGESVEVLGQDCGARGFRVLGGAQTRTGGGWEHQNPEQVAPWRSWVWGSGITFRARWSDKLSEPVVLRLPAAVWAVKLPGCSRALAHVSS
jgi:hypothetical protein